MAMNLFRSSKRTSLHQDESGQAIVILALMMLGLMASLGLAIDGGGLFFLYRDTQNGTDAAVVAATYARCTNGDIVFAGMQAAADNGFDNNGTTNWVTVTNPPTTGTGAGDLDYVEVIITADKPSYFIQLVYPDQLSVTSRAVGRCSPPLDPATIPALFGISSTCNNTVNWNGSDATIATEVVGGPAIHSNFEVQSGGGGHTNEIVGSTTSVGAMNQGNDGNTTWSPAYQQNLGSDYIQDDPLGKFFRLADFAPDTGRIWLRSLIRTHIADGSPDFHNGDWRPNGPLEGLYYVEGSVHINNATYGPQGVTIVATGTIDFSSGVALHYYVDGFLLFSGHQGSNCGDNAISISGSSGYWYGIIYAPGAGVNIRASDMQITGSIIADTIDFSGSTLRLTYDPDILDPIPASVVVSE
jgi:hypothetical protein